MNICCSEDIIWLLSKGYSSHKLRTTLRKLFGHHTDFVHKFDTSVSRMLKGLYNNCDI